jgi:hypothetical protein
LNDKVKKVNLLPPGFEENPGRVRRETNPVTESVGKVGAPGLDD